jgi:predicted SAM-dependent methyltransferase
MLDPTRNIMEVPMKKLLTRFLGLFISRESISQLKTFLRSVRNDYQSKRYRRQPTEALPHPPPHKLNIGCGRNIKDGWINIDMYPPADITIDVRNRLPFPNSSCELIYSEHFLEHLSCPNESFPFLKECYRVLSPGCAIHVGVPDSRYVVESCMKEPIDPKFLRKAKKYNWRYPDYCHTGFEFINYHFRLEGQHQFAFDFITLKSHLEHAGFVDVRERGYNANLDTMSRAEGTLYIEAKKPAG